MRNLSILFILTSLFLSSCATRLSVARLTSDSEDITWEQGRQIVKTSNDDFTMFTVFERSEGKDLIFDVEVFNHSGQTILVDPLSFNYHAFDSENQDVTSVGANRAEDPEIKLLDIQKGINQVDADVKNQAATGAALFAAGMVLTVATAALLSESDGGVAVEYSPTLVMEDDATTEAEATYRKENKKSEYDFVANNFLRKTTVLSGESVRGTVSFKADFNARNYIFHFPMGDEILNVGYKQHLY